MLSFCWCVSVKRLTMTSVKQEFNKWEREVPGARWFKADLHIHTIDDHFGNIAQIPPEIGGRADSPDTISHYARRFLQALVRNNVQVAGLTPHSPRAGDQPQTSAVWKIVEEWLEGKDDDRVPFRDKIYAVFPGFEPSLNAGKKGLHLLFLFDSEIGLDRYLRAFDQIMGGVSPWNGETLQVSEKRPEIALKDLRNFHNRECQNGNCGSYLILAPHIDADNGFLGTRKAQVLQIFEHDVICGLELGDHKLPEHTLKNRSWLQNGMRKHRQALFHASDAYSFDELGQRYVWIKLASRKIESLRQAFLASDSRVQFAFESSGGNESQAISELPDVRLNHHPWLREITVSGAASYFGDQNSSSEVKASKFRFSPDLTCIIGGSMTGKSTLLDGLRVYSKAPLPEDNDIRQDVDARGLHFAAAADISWECPGSDKLSTLRDQWPAQFFAQNELQRLTHNPSAIEEILAKLVSHEIKEIEDCHENLRVLDRQITKLVKELNSLDKRIENAEHYYQKSLAAKRELSAFSEAGVDRLFQASQTTRSWSLVHSEALELQSHLHSMLEQYKNAPDIPAIDKGLLEILHREKLDLDSRWQNILVSLENIFQTSKSWISDVAEVVRVTERLETEQRILLDRVLAEMGFSSSKLQEINALHRRASLAAYFKEALDEIELNRENLEQSLRRKKTERREFTKRLRDAYDRVIEYIRRTFGKRVQVHRNNQGDLANLDNFLANLNQKGISRWWNDLDKNRKPDSDTLIDHFNNDSLSGIGMSDAVQKTFKECLIRSKRRELESIRCPDRYSLELRMDDGSYRQLEYLSGGQKVSVLLSLLLETEDSRPLVIDQPEDALDNQFLLNTVLPALRKLRGRRQVIVATHNANIVVNGDADMVIQLEAVSNHGWVACSGTIDQPEIRDAIVRTVDGGKEAFRLRQRKYGY